ncbi:MAG TPA: transcription elongation factor subunit Spt4 [Candidatus Nanoarchaeia archaeon]|nr:transcription elongation factor subunit Spt4 [Candidatus Nanoarchaeia archaeon]
MATEKACKKCRFVFEGSKCPKCGSDEITDSFKGKVVILKPEESDIGKNLKLKEKGTYAIKVK